MKKKYKSKKFDSVKNMPELHHKLPDQDFELEKSEVLNFLKNDEGTMQWLFDTMNSSGLIVYNPETKKWRGKDYGL